MTDIEWFFKEYVFGFMYHDIDAVICGKANFLAALGLLEYTEFMGGLVLEELGKKKNKANQYTLAVITVYLRLKAKVKVLCFGEFKPL